jgi:hypothetical protein
MKGEKIRRERRTIQEVLGTTNRLLSLIRREPHRKRKIREDTQTHRQQGDLIRLLTKIRGDMQTDGQTQTDTQTDGGTDSKVIP